ncbi:metallo-dependent phosphatase-like protein [Vibrio phage 1.244.A._10N.261.54.C3]|nr:metallo-dependent phosphatase-like protein [Vibrio phage 1.244.A._10N.261.54.C3]AUR98662.1 metallo-dependent phosphatase-like protein [Vibrio phage 1.255.O._10N.286.45.F1]
MKIGKVGDLHVGARGGSIHMREFIKSYIINYLMPKFHEAGVNYIIQAGDFFDVRKALQGRDRDWLINEFIPACEKYEQEWHVDVGNHDITLRDSNSINWPAWLAEESQGYVVAYSDPCDVMIGDTLFCMIPWINKENSEDIAKHIEESKAEYAIAHLELAGFPMYQGSTCEQGQVDVSMLRKFKRVDTGHFHCRSQDGNIHYLGTPYHLNWQDHKDGTNRGIYIFDSETGETEFIANNESQSVFRVLEYDWDGLSNAGQDKDWLDKDYLENDIGLKGQVIRVIVRDRASPLHMKKFKAVMNTVDCIDKQFIDMTEQIATEDIVITEEVLALDTLDVLKEKIHSTDGIRHDDVSKKMEATYMTAINLGGLVSDNN